MLYSFIFETDDFIENESIKDLQSVYTQLFYKSKINVKDKFAF